jgi:hypothetical protein
VVGKGVGDRSSPVADPSRVQGGESGACPWGVSGLWRAPIVPMLRRVALCVVTPC